MTKGIDTLAGQDLLRGPRWLLMAVASLIVSLPLIWMFLSSFKTTEELSRIPPTIWPLDVSLAGYEYIFTKLPFGRYFLNSVIVSSLSTALALFTSSLAGYIFAKFEFAGKKILFILILSSMMIPGAIMIIPRYLLINWFHWNDTYLALIVPQGISIFGIYLMRQYMHGVPSDYIDAARVDGMSEIGIFLKIMLPLCKPALAALAILCFVESWGALLWPLIVVSSPEYKTLPLGIAGLATVHSPLLHLMLPAAVVSVLPVIIVFALFQKQFVNAMTSSGLK